VRLAEFITEDIDDILEKKKYMEGKCNVLAIAIHKYNPQRFQLGFVYEYNFAEGSPDMYLQPDEYGYLSTSEQKEIKLNATRWSLVHAFVFDKNTSEYIDATGRHKTVPTLYNLNLTRKLVFPATVDKLIKISLDMTWDDRTEEWIIVRGKAAFDKHVAPFDMESALNYAKRNLAITD
jgi:hypothetical protein